MEEKAVLFFEHGGTQIPPNYNSLDIIHYFFLIIVLSLILNLIAIYGTCRQKHIIKSDYVIKLLIFQINLAFTLISIPFYCVKEAKLLKTTILCQLFHSINDFLIISYMNTYCFIAINRYRSVCVNRMKEQTKQKEVLKKFILVSSLIASISLINFMNTECEIYIKGVRDVTASTLKTCKSMIFYNERYPYMRERYSTNYTISTNFFISNRSRILITKFYQITLSFVVIINLLIATCLYIIIIRYLFRKNKKFSSKYSNIVLNKANAEKITRRLSVFDFDFYTSTAAAAAEIADGTTTTTTTTITTTTKKRRLRFSNYIKTNTSCLNNPRNSVMSSSNDYNNESTVTTKQSISIPIDEVSTSEIKQLESASSQLLQQQQIPEVVLDCDNILPLPQKQFRSVSMLPFFYSKNRIRKSYSLPVTISDSRNVKSTHEKTKLKKNKPSYLRKQRHVKSAKLFFSLILTFLLITVPWFLTLYEIICYYPLLYYLYCMEVIISPLIHFLFNCKMS